MAKRRNFLARFRAKVALEALRGERTVSEPAARYEILPNLITTWKKRAREGLVDVFSSKVEKRRSVSDAKTQGAVRQDRRTDGGKGANFRWALNRSESLGLEIPSTALAQCLAFHALLRRRFATARELYERLAKLRRRTKNPEGDASAYHQLGGVSQEEGDFSQARDWYRKSLAIF